MRLPAPPAPFPARRRRRSVRLRLTALYGALSVLSGAVVVTGIYSWEASAASVQPATPAPPAASGQQSPLAQAQARIGQLAVPGDSALRPGALHQLRTGSRPRWRSCWASWR